MERNILFLSLLFLLTHCSTTQKQVSEITSGAQLKSVQHSTPNQVNGIKWTLVGMKGVNLSTVNFYEGSPWVQFSVADLKMNGSTGCNSFGGGFEVKEDSLKVGMLMTTKKFCEGIPEPEFLNLLGTTDSYCVENNLLNLKSKGKIILTFTQSSN
jgi:heat shock protein HslJ